MKKRLLFLSTLLGLSLSVCIITSPSDISFLGYANISSSSPDCETLKSTRTPISQILTDEYNANASHMTNTIYSTWGTVTAIYTQNNYYHAFIQSGDAALCLYSIQSTNYYSPIQVGDFVTANGYVTYYNGMYEMIINGTSNSFQVESSIKSYDVIPEFYNIDLLANNASESIHERNIKTGNVRVCLNNLTINSITSNYALVNLPGSNEDIKLYYGGIGAKTDIYNKFLTIYNNGNSVSVTGYLNVFDKNGKRETQLLIRYTSDIYEIEEDTFVPVSNISIDLLDNTEINVDDYLLVNATISPKNASNKNIIWESSNPYIASINEYGEIVTYNVGETIITAKSAQNNSIYISSKLIVSIKNILPTSVEFDKTNFEIDDYGQYYISTKVGEIGTLNYSIYPDDATNKEVTYSLEGDVDAITFDETSNKWVAVSEGEVNIKITSVADTSVYDIVSIIVSKNEDSCVYDTISFDSYSPGTYTTNFGSGLYGNYDYKYNYYRVAKSGDIWKLYPSSNLLSFLDDSLPGSFSNETGNYAISKMTITYSGEGVIRYGDDKYCSSYTNLSYSYKETTVDINTNDAFFFYIEADKGQTLSLSSIEFKYNINKEFIGSIISKSRVNTRIPATTYNGELIDGVSYVDVPIDIDISNNNYTVKETKRYTYYSFDYVYENKDSLDLDSIALTDPIDVANYYIAFKCVPANYIAKNSVTRINSQIGNQDDVVNLFGSNARYVSQYNRTDGYCNGLPYYGLIPIYLEFDIDSNGYYTLTNRDVSRVVIWATGWRTAGYGHDIPVAAYTDDHYITFREYNNYGGWNLPFDSVSNGTYTQQRTMYTYSSTVTLSNR